MIREILHKGKDSNKSKIMKELIKITDMDSKFKHNYVIEWKVKKLDE